MQNPQPALDKSAFECPHCDAYAQQRWEPLLAKTSMRTPAGGVTSGHVATDVKRAKCEACGLHSLWLVNYRDGAVGNLIWPGGKTTTPQPHTDMPADVQIDFNEARLIAGTSPRGAAALLRLAIQKLMPHLGAKSGNLNEDIALLVKHGLPVLIQQAMDVVRVTGNNAVHPGEIVFDDTNDTANALFEFINLIVDNRIAEPARINKVFGSLPNGALSAISKRDGTP